MVLLICPGIHSPELTTNFLQSLSLKPEDVLVVPGDRYPVYSGFHVVRFLQAALSTRIPSTEIPATEISVAGISTTSVDPAQRLASSALPPCRPPSFTDPETSILLLAFSAGVVGAITAAHLWQAWGGKIQALIAIDGWGIPLYGNFPIHRLSHDAFTHWSSTLLEPGQTCFYADPAVSHLSLWQLPKAAIGWVVAPVTHRCSFTRCSFTRCSLTHFNPREFTPSRLVAKLSCSADCAGATALKNNRIDRGNTSPNNTSPNNMSDSTISSASNLTNPTPLMRMSAADFLTHLLHQYGYCINMVRSPYSLSPKNP